MENNIRIAIRKVLMETRYEDIRNKIQSGRSSLETSGKITGFIFTAVDIVRKLLSFEKNFMNNVKENSEFRNDLHYISVELDLLKDLISEIPK
jgi:hypothetical protein